MDTFKVKTGDLEPALTLQLLSDGQPVSIHQAMNATVVVRAQRGATTPKVRRQGTILDQNTAQTRGLVKLVWQPGDTDTAGTYYVEVEIEWTAGRKQTFPGDGYALMNIEADLG